MQNDNYKKIKSVFYIVAIISMVIAIFNKVHAEDIQVNNLKEYYKTLLNPNGINNYDYDSLLDFDTFPYTFMLKNTDGVAIFMWKYDNYVLKAMNDGNLNDAFKWTTYMFGGSNYDDQIAFKNTWTRNNTDAIGRILIYDISSNPSFICADYYATDNPKFNSANTYCWAPGASRQITNIPYNKNRVDKFIISSTSASDIYIPEGITVHYCGYGSSNISGSTYKGIITYSMPNVNKIIILNNNTDGLKVYKQTIHNQSFLYIDYSDLQNIVPTYLEISSVFGNIDVDGTIFEIDYDSSSPYYHINLSTGKVYYQIPFSSLHIDDENIESAILKNLKVNVSWSTTINNGENEYFWVTPLYLIGSPHETPGYTPDSSNEQPAQTYTPEMNSEYYLNIYSMYHNGHTGNPFKYKDNISIYSTHQLALDSIKLDADVMEIDTWYINSSDKTLYASNTDLFGDYIYDNGFGLFYDAIVFDIYDRHVDGVVNPVNVYKGTGVLFTEKYYTRNGLMSITDSLKDVIQYDHMCSDYLYLLYDVTWKKLKSIDYNIADYFTKQGNVTSQIILMLENINSFLPDIKGLLDNILDSLKNLKLTQLDTIDTKLTTIIDNISTPDTPFNEDDTVAEAIKYYETHNNNGVPTGQVYIDDKMSIWISGKVHLWLQGSNANSDKTSLINSVFETLTSIYDSMKNNNDIFPNIQYYLDAIAKNNNYGYKTHGDYMTRFFKGNVDISTYNGISE